MDTDSNSISGKEFDVTSQRVAASNPLLRDAFVEALEL